jgi:hypothetical protein
MKSIIKYGIIAVIASIAIIYTPLIYNIIDNASRA